MKLLLIFYCLVVTTACYGQRYTFAKITATADSILNAKAGPLFLYCQHADKDCYYSYQGKKQVQYKKWGRTKTRRHFIAATVHYNFVAPYPECPCMDTITGGITLNLDTALVLTNDVDLGFVPQFVTAHDSCRFITKQAAIDIALQQSLHTSVAPPYAYIKSTSPGNNYVWVVLRTIWNEKATSGMAHAKDDMVIIDALTGNVKENKVIPYAPHVY